jgi:hypothetical protein
MPRAPSDPGGCPAVIRGGNTATSLRSRGEHPRDSSVCFGPDLLGVANSSSNAWGDSDNDGDLDLAVSLGSGEVRLYRNDVGVLVSVGAEMRMPQAGSHELRGLSWGDFDGDGDIDLLGGATVADKPSVVLRNDGSAFVDVATAIGLTIPGRSARQTNWIDYDNDGGLDLSVTDGYGPKGGDFVFRNTMSAEAKRRSLSVLVLDAKGHHTRFGAEVRLLDRAVA